jgi:hypothetical protein
MGGKMSDLNKSYLGYRPKQDNLVKLTQYLTAKNADKTNKNVSLNKLTKLSTNQVLKNKRF